MCRYRWNIPVQPLDAPSEVITEEIVIPDDDGSIVALPTPNSDAFWDD